MNDSDRTDLINQWNSLLWVKKDNSESKVVSNLKEEWDVLEFKEDEICCFKIGFTTEWKISPSLAINWKFEWDYKNLDKWAEAMMKFLNSDCIVWILRTLVDMWAKKEHLWYAIFEMAKECIELLHLWDQKLFDMFSHHKSKPTK